MKWEKLGVVYDPTKSENRPDWRYDFAQGINSLIYEDFIRIYFCCREKPDMYGRTVSRMTYLDVDKKDPTKVIQVADHPVIELGGLGEFDEFGQYPFSVIRDGDIIRGFYGGITRCESVPFNAAIGECISRDNGDHFEKIGRGPVLSYSYDEPFIIGSPKIRKFGDIFYMTYCSGRKWTIRDGKRAEVCYKLRMDVSKDAVNWEKWHRNLIQDKLGENESQACGDILYRNGVYHMFYCYRGHEDFRRNPAHSYRIGYALSKDLITWERKDEIVGIDLSEEGFDNEMIAYPHVFETDGETYMLYLGNEVGKYGFGIARLDGEIE
jgi:predicted GH43/DUF377 family glycosyl hydrolase